MTDWHEHNGGPQPVADDVWVEVDDAHNDHLVGPASDVAWDRREWLRWNVINQHLIDAKQAEIDRLQHEVMRLDDALNQTGDAVVYGYALLDDMDDKIDAARLEGIRLGLEAAVKAIDTLDDWGASDDAWWVRGEASEAIAALDPTTIAKEATND